jgi:hypothetical protein
MLEDFIYSGTEASSSRAGVRSRWSRPPSGGAKVNTDDAAFSMATGTGCTGAVPCDEMGGVMAAAARSYSNIADVLMAEALVAGDGMLLPVEQEAMKVILETDNATVVTLLHQMMESVAVSLVFGMKLESLACLLLLLFVLMLTGKAMRLPTCARACHRCLPLSCPGLGLFRTG